MQADKELHDKLKAELPESASCIDNCPFCAETEQSSEGEEKVSDNKVYTQEALDALLADARTKAAEEARAEADKALAEVQAQLTERESALEAATSRLEELQGEIEKRDEDARLAQVAEERAEKVSEVTDFTEEQIDERKAVWASLTDEAFASVLADFKTATESAKAHGGSGSGKLPASKFEATRETAGGAGTDTKRLREFLMASDS